MKNSDLCSDLVKYRGANTSISINSKNADITFLNCGSSGDSIDDQVVISFIWRSVTEDYYDFLRSSINEKVRIKIGREEFMAKIVDTSTIIPGTEFDDFISDEFELVISELESMQITSTKKYSSSIFCFSITDADLSKVSPMDVEYPHITLVYLPGDLVSDADLENIINDIQEFCKTQRHIEIETTGRTLKFGPDEDLNYAYVAEIKPTNDLTNFRDSIKSICAHHVPGLFDNEKFPHFKPHLTLAYSDRQDLKLRSKQAKWVQKDLSLNCMSDEPTHVWQLSAITDIVNPKNNSASDADDDNIIDLIVNNLIAMVEDLSDINVKEAIRLASATMSIATSPIRDFASASMVLPKDLSTRTLKTASKLPRSYTFDDFVEYYKIERPLLNIFERANGSHHRTK